MICLVNCAGIISFSYDAKQSASNLTVDQIMNSFLQNSDLNWRKWPFRYDLNQILYDYTVGVANDSRNEIWWTECLKNYG